MTLFPCFPSLSIFNKHDMFGFDFLRCLPTVFPELELCSYLILEKITGGGQLPEISKTYSRSSFVSAALVVFFSNLNMNAQQTDQDTNSNPELSGSQWQQ